MPQKLAIANQAEVYVLAYQLVMKIEEDLSPTKYAQRNRVPRVFYRTLDGTLLEDVSDVVRAILSGTLMVGNERA